MTQQQEPTLNKRTTQTLEARKQRAEKKSLWFFIRRAPFRTIEREWKRPTDDQYNNDLMAEGFISPALVEHPLSDELKTDLRELDEHLLPHFWQANQRARFFQNRYYQYQWAFILAAFFTTALAAVNVFFHAQGWSGETSAGTIVGPIQWTEALGFLTALMSGVAAAVSFLDANQTPQKRWYKARVQAEIMRSLYFLYLARQKPFDTPSERERVQRLRSKVLEVLRETVAPARRDDRAPAQPRAAPQPGTSPSPRPRRSGDAGTGASE